MFARPSAWHHHSNFLIRQKWLRSDRLTREQRALWADRSWWAAYGLFALDDRRAASCLWLAFRHSGRPRAAALALTAGLGVSRAGLVRLRQVVAGMVRDTPT